VDEVHAKEFDRLDTEKKGESDPKELVGSTVSLTHSRAQQI
jgi:hypothetical protein